MLRRYGTARSQVSRRRLKRAAARGATSTNCPGRKSYRRKSRMTRRDASGMRALARRESDDDATRPAKIRMLGHGAVRLAEKRRPTARKFNSVAAKTQTEHPFLADPSSVDLDEGFDGNPRNAPTFKRNDRGNGKFSGGRILARRFEIVRNCETSCFRSTFHRRMRMLVGEGSRLMYMRVMPAFSADENRPFVAGPNLPR